MAGDNTNKYGRKEVIIKENTMAYRYTNTEKWDDNWFSSLKQVEMLLFMYLCDNCDIAGFAEVNFKRWAVDLNSSPGIIKEALKGLQRGIIISQDNDAVYLRNFLKHQKNLPLNTNNKAHVGIIRRFDLYMYKFNIQDINEFIESSMIAPSKGLQRGTGNGNGNGIGIGNGIKGGMGEKDDPDVITPEVDEDFYLFDNFWDDYDKKVGSKEKLRKKWKSISDVNKLKIKDHIRLYKISQPDKMYRKNPETYINNKSWNDEIITSNGNRHTANKRAGITEDYKNSILARLQGASDTEDVPEHNYTHRGF